MNNNTKQCARCKQMFPENEQNFGKKRKRYLASGDAVYSFRPYCIECRRAIKRESAQRNREVNIRRSAKWYAENKESVRQSQREKYWTDSEYRALTIQRALKYQGLHPYQAKASWHRRSELYKQAEGEITTELIEMLYNKQNGYCAYCGQDTKGNFHIDHIVPLSREGTNLEDNLCIACPTCNLSKADKLLSEWTENIRWYNLVQD